MCIRDSVWIGNGCLILKGSTVPDVCVIGAKSIVSGSNFVGHSIIVWSPAKSVKRIGDFKI